MTKRELLKRFFSPVRHKPKHFIACGIIALLGALHAISYARYFQQMTIALEAKDMEMFFWWIGILCATAITWLCIRLFDRKHFFNAVRDADVYIYSKYITKFFYAESTITEKIGTWRITGILKWGIFAWSAMLAEAFWDYLKVIFTILISLIIIASKSQVFLLEVIIVLIFIFYRITVFAHKSGFRRRNMKNVYVEMERNLVRQVMSKVEILQNNRVWSEIEKYKAYANEALQFRYKEKFRQAVGYDGSLFFINIFRALLIGFVGYGILVSTATLADFVLMLTLTWILVSMVSDLTLIGRKISDHLVHIEKMRDTFDKFTYAKNLNTGEQFQFTHGNIVLDGLTFGYSIWKSQIAALDITLPGKKKTALVGPSWGGKSTLIKLIAGYLQPTDGAILIDGQSLSEIHLLSYYRHVGYLTQDPSVFDGTIRENLEYGMATDAWESADLDTVIKLAKCEWIYELSKWLNTEIGERWVRLSGGQKQRLAIAKIMLKNPNIILLDEPTSALDSYNEEQVTIALNNLFEGKTVLIVAHRLQTVKNADEILYIDEGKVIERGTHNELVALQGEYYKMVELQSGF